MNAVSPTNFIPENGSGTESDTNTDDDDSPEHYQPIVSNSDDDDDVNSQFHRLPNGHTNGVLEVDLSDEDEEDEETKRREEAANAAMREDERRRNAPLGEENASRVVEAMHGIRFSGIVPVWAERVPEEEWIGRVRRAREFQETPRNLDV